MQLIPAIDLKDGQCVRLLRGNFAAETRYASPPHALLERYRTLGADWVHVVDLDGARDGARGNRDLILDMAQGSPLKLQVGGGLRDSAAVAGALDGGARRVVIGSAAATRFELVRRWLEDFGPDRVVLAFDVRLDALRSPQIAIHGWRETTALTLWDAVNKYADHDVKHVLCTDISRDGALSGPNVELYDEAVRRYPHIEWQASGGVRDSADLQALERAGVHAAISGKALLDDLIPSEELRPYLPNASFPA